MLHLWTHCGGCAIRGYVEFARFGHSLSLKQSSRKPFHVTAFFTSETAEQEVERKAAQQPRLAERELLKALKPLIIPSRNNFTPTIATKMYRSRILWAHIPTHRGPKKSSSKPRVSRRSHARRWTHLYAALGEVNTPGDKPWTNRGRARGPLMLV